MLKNIIMNGIPMQEDSSMTILDVARKHGVDIPTLNKTEYVKYLLFFLNFSLKLLFLFFALFLCMSAHVRYKNGRLIY